jgi:uncharacterized protein (DUF488 family)
MSKLPPIFTIGHSTRPIEEFVDILRAGPAELVVDVRTVPKSRRNPQYNEDALPDELAPYQLGYRRIAGLGGLRGKSHDVPPQVNAYWQNQSFHNYADYALSDDFARALDELLELSSERRVAIMCAEAVWWRCHRRIISDYLIERGRDVRHLMAAGRVEPARLTPGAQPEDGKIHYPLKG